MNIGIIGGGASGVMAAICASGKGSVTIFEHNSRLLKKLLVTGNGRCNYTNSDMDISHFHGTDVSFIAEILNRFGYEDTVEFFKKTGVYPKSRNGYIYPYSDQASSVADCLLAELKKRRVNIILECSIREVDFKNNAFTVVTDDKSYKFDKLIIAAGSFAAPKTGSDGSGFNLIRNIGIEINKPLPALCSLICKESFYKSVAGVRCSAKVSIFVNDVLKKSDTGELQLTDYGISGIPVFQISYIASKALNKKKDVFAEIDFIPELDDDELCKLIADRISANSGKSTHEMLTGLFNDKLCRLFSKLLKNACAESGVSSNTDVNKLVSIIKHFKTRIKATNTFENAQVCTGGIKLTELKNTLECNKVDGLYFAGEILDVNGDCGGYNLQWAWASGYVAGCLE